MEIPEIITLSKKNITDFAKERNKLLLKARKKWVLFLDSDEKLSNQELQIEDDVPAYFLTRKNYFLGKLVGIDRIIRLMKKGSGSWKRRVHELYHLAGDTKIGEIKNAYIVHNTADNLADYIKKINLYSTLHAKANQEDGKKSNLIKIIFFPSFKFISTLIKSKNVVFSIMQAFHSYLSWSKLYFLQS